MPCRLTVLVARCLLVSLAIVFAHNPDDDVRDDDVTGSPRPWSPGGRGGGYCAGCAQHEVLHQLPQADVIQLHVERIKRELLRKLGLSAPPNVTGIHLPSILFLPRPVLSAHQENTRDDVTDEDGVFPDDEFDYEAAMSDGVVSASQHHDDYYHDDDDGDDDAHEDGFEEEYDLDDDDLGPPEPPPRSKQIIVFGEQLNRCVQRAGDDCYRFPLNSIGAHVDVTSAHLWLYKTRDVIGHHFADAIVGARNQTIMVRLIPRTEDVDSGGEASGGNWPRRSPRRRILASVTVRRRSGCWVRIDVRRTVLAHLHRSRGRSTSSAGVRMAVGCRGGCVLARGRTTAHGGSDRRPVLVIGTVETRRKRRRRTLDDATCPRSQCCLHRLYIDFARIGWSFIKQPQGYEINYCHGSCNFRSWENDATRGYLAMLLYLGRQRGLRAALPCCSATATKAVSLLYVDHDGAIVKQDVPNMQVLECGCA